jgi:hypothetical protein
MGLGQQKTISAVDEFYSPESVKQICKI